MDQGHRRADGEPRAARAAWVKSAVYPSLSGKKVLITGASKGIGLACAHGFAAEGAEVRIAARTEAALVELSVPRFEREEHDRLTEVVPLYLRKSDAEINLDRGLRAGQ